MAKKTKKSAKQVKLEKKIATLKKEHHRFTRQKIVLDARLKREGVVRRRQLDKLDKAAERAQVAFDKFDEKPLPSQSARNKFGEKLYKIEDKIRAAENDLRAFASQATAEKKAEPDREAGEETEE